MACGASFPYKDNFFISCTHDKTKLAKKRTSMNQILKRTQYEINDNLDY